MTKQFSLNMGFSPGYEASVMCLIDNLTIVVDDGGRREQRERQQLLLEMCLLACIDDLVKGPKQYLLMPIYRPKMVKSPSL